MTATRSIPRPGCPRTACTPDPSRDELGPSRRGQARVAAPRCLGSTEGPAEAEPTDLCPRWDVKTPGSPQIPHVRPKLIPVCPDRLPDPRSSRDLLGHPGDHGWDVESRLVRVRPGGRVAQAALHQLLGLPPRRAARSSTHARTSSIVGLSPASGRPDRVACPMRRPGPAPASGPTPRLRGDKVHVRPRPALEDGRQRTTVETPPHSPPPVTAGLADRVTTTCPTTMTLWPAGPRSRSRGS